MIRPCQSWPGPFALIACAVTALAGCAGDSAHYVCAGYPSKPMCLPPSAIYALTQGAGPAPTAEPRPSTLGGAVRTGDDAPLVTDNGRGPTRTRP